MVLDASNITVNIGGNIFKSFAKSIIEEGWYKVGKYYEEQQIEGEDVEFPLNISSGDDITNDRLEVKKFDVYERAPKRFSPGSLMSRANKDLFVEDAELTNLIDDLEETGLINLYVKNMIQPTQKARHILYLLKEYLPEILDDEFIIKSSSDLKLVSEGKLEKEVPVNDYIKLLTLLKERVGYEETLIQEENNKKEEAKRIAKENNQEISENVLRNKKLLNQFLIKNDRRIEKLGYCPSCKKGEVFKKDKGFACNNISCNFILWNNRMEQFFEKFNKQIMVQNIEEYLKVLLSKGELKAENFYFNDNFFDPTLVIIYDEEYKNWSIKFKPKVEKKIITTAFKEQENDSNLNKLVNYTYVDLFSVMVVCLAKCLCTNTCTLLSIA